MSSSDWIAASKRWGDHCPGRQVWRFAGVRAIHFQGIASSGNCVDSYSRWATLSTASWGSNTSQTMSFSQFTRHLNRSAGSRRCEHHTRKRCYCSTLIIRYNSTEFQVSMPGSLEMVPSRGKEKSMSLKLHFPSQGVDQVATMTK